MSRHGAVTARLPQSENSAFLPPEACERSGSRGGLHWTRLRTTENAMLDPVKRHSGFDIVGHRLARGSGSGRNATPRLPPAPELAAQMIALENDERSALAVAKNRIRPFSSLEGESPVTFARTAPTQPCQAWRTSHPRWRRWRRRRTPTFHRLDSLRSRSL